MYCDTDGDCLLWRNGVNGQGYPQANINGKVVLVRRYVYTCLCGKKLGKYEPLASLCDNKLCVSPDCIRKTTHTEVLRRAYKHGKRNTAMEYAARLRRASEDGMCKLSWEKVQQIRELSPTHSDSELGRRYGVHHKTIGSIRKGKSWRMVTKGSTAFTWRP